MTGVVIELLPHLLLFGGLEGRCLRSGLQMRNVGPGCLASLRQRLDAMRFGQVQLAGLRVALHYRVVLVEDMLVAGEALSHHADTRLLIRPLR